MTTKIASRAKSRLYLVLFLAASVLGGCAADPNQLDGSLERFYDLSYATVRARLYSGELSIEFVRETGEVPLRVTMRRDSNLTTGVSFVERGGKARFDAIREDDPSAQLPEYAEQDVLISGRSGDTDMPDMIRGTVIFSAFDVFEESRIAGEFTASFQVGEDEASLTGRFDTTLELVDMVPGYEYLWDIDFGEMGDMGALDAAM
ncbi:MAG: hypothetical protein AAGI01_10200 [Myxococcota bacterium]